MSHSKRKDVQKQLTWAGGRVIQDKIYNKDFLWGFHFYPEILRIHGRPLVLDFLPLIFFPTYFSF